MADQPTSEHPIILMILGALFVATFLGLAAFSPAFREAIHSFGN